MRVLARGYHLVFSALGLVSALLIGAVAVGMSLDVIQRNLGLGTVPWMLEACEYAIFVSTFLGAPWVLHLGAHVRVDVFVQNLPKPVTFLFELFADVVGMATSGVIL